MIRKPISQQMHLAIGAASIACMVLAYSWLSHQRHQVNPKDTTIPNGTQFVQGWRQMSGVDAWEKIRSRSATAADGEDHAQQTYFQFLRSNDSEGKIWLRDDLCATFGRLLAGLAIGVLLSLVFGVAMGCFLPVEAFCLPPLSFFAKIPPTAMLAVYFVVFGTESKLFVAMIALGIFPTLAQAIFQAAKTDVSSHAIDKAYTLGASHMEVIWNVIYPQILPRIIENVRLQIGPAMVFLIAAEWLVADVGIGYRLRIQSRLLHMNVAYTYLAILGIAGFGFDWCLSIVRRKCSPWFGK